MHILVFNAGSSSLKFGIFSVGAETREVLKGAYERFRNGACEYRFRYGDRDQRGTTGFATPAEAMSGVPEALERAGFGAIDAIGHRFVHGGARFSVPTVLNEEVIAAIEALTPLAPLHNPANLGAARLCRRLCVNDRGNGTPPFRVKGTPVRACEGHAG